MKLIRNLSILLAGTLLLLHGVLPHDHHEELEETIHVTQHESASGLLDFLALAFHLDQGEGHLDDYQPEASYHLACFSLYTDLISIGLQPAMIVDVEELYFSYQVKLPSRYFSAYPSFRGPPTQA